ncbi:single-stranded DNA-binding protein [Anaplasma marginale str. Dawn]|uniref:SsrA-binding protein n=2 Tax=Anaplasma marginale TaxID=770 RepID=SSRP_ANAMF|nr:SsrA-binding protein SmpB [Anaplasma marginale]B9KH06.1 RecName: Full=SsrA-binding protein; AltName: Full=Small protein B [Anaplasma marginale str. Florida]ACM49710.1 small protein B-like protein (smpB) [Anaplasma marginale str. Florida]AGZ79180.1 single-stranded DNA-binding protein [Anaplasma marginale str. Gypsy Plains]AGZ79975.1 single-stranded DNA-binding protein [Anaplasma marginale str. Dawn]AXW84385.1 SsrA-binding protein [Anaplasma marginale]AXW85314.1 SsrA-binding protein [Anaplas
MEIVAENRKARFDYFVLQEYDAGMVLVGSEVKSLRQRKVNMGDAYVLEKDMELWIHNLHISEYNRSDRKNHKPLRVRKLLLRKREIHKIAGNIKVSGLAVVPLMIFFNNKGIAKIKIAIVKGKKLYDKREAIKTRDWQREKSRISRREV